RRLGKHGTGQGIGDSGRRELAGFLHVSLMRLDPINGIERAVINLPKLFCCGTGVAIAQVPQADITVLAVIGRHGWISEFRGVVPDSATALDLSHGLSFQLSKKLILLLPYVP